MALLLVLLPLLRFPAMRVVIVVAGLLSRAPGTGVRKCVQCAKVSLQIDKTKREGVPLTSFDRFVAFFFVSFTVAAATYRGVARKQHKTRFELCAPCRPLPNPQLPAWRLFVSRPNRRS